MPAPTAQPLLSFSNTTKRAVDTRHFPAIQRATLPAATYDLSVVFCGDARAQKLNVAYRNKDYTPNVLSFPVTKTSGEIFLNLAQIDREAKKYNHTPEEHLHFLFIHGCLHLAGHDHSSTMEEAECRVMRTIFPAYSCT